MLLNEKGGDEPMFTSPRILILSRFGGQTRPQRRQNLEVLPDQAGETLLWLSPHAQQYGP